MEPEVGIRVPFTHETRTQENPYRCYLLLWMLGIPLPILLPIWMVGGLHSIQTHSFAVVVNPPRTITH